MPFKDYLSSQLFHRVSPYIKVYLIFWLFCIVLLALFGYRGSFLWANARNSAFWDLIMPHWTHLGDGALLISLIALWVGRKNAALIISMIMCLLLLTFIVQIGKLWLFSPWERPLTVFENSESFHYVATNILRYNAFPSGHSATAAALMGFILIGLDASTTVYYGIAIFSVITCYTRVYIGVHFIGDILAGSIIGVACFLFSAHIIYPELQKKLSVMDPEKFKSLTLILNIFMGVVTAIAFIFLVSVHYW